MQKSIINLVIKASTSKKKVDAVNNTDCRSAENPPICPGKYSGSSDVLELQISSTVCQVALQSGAKWALL